MFAVGKASGCKNSVSNGRTMGIAPDGSRRRGECHGWDKMEGAIGASDHIHVMRKSTEAEEQVEGEEEESVGAWPSGFSAANVRLLNYQFRLIGLQILLMN